MLVDSAAQRRLTVLLEAATDKRKPSIEPEILREVKKACKASEGNVKIAFDVLLERLKLPHAQTRLYALEVVDQLFSRSKAFRALLAPHFTHFLELTIGFRPEKPLPPPAAAAQQLRERALEVIERWNDDFGALYKQIGMGCRYLKETLKYKFPELRARQAAARAEQREREARAQQILLDKFHRIQDEFAETAAELQSTVAQMEECFALAEGRHAVGAAALQPPQPSAGAARDDENEAEQWEDVAARPAADPAPLATGEAEGQEAEADGDEGLAAYAVEDMPEDLMETVADLDTPVAGDAAPQLLEVDKAVAETLRGLHKLLAQRHMPLLQEYLKILTKVDVGERGSEEHAQHGRLLRDTISLREQATAAAAKFDVIASRLPPEEAHRVAAGSSDGAADEGITSVSGGIHPEAAGAAAASSAMRPGARGRQRHNNRGQTPAAAVVGPSPYDSIVDPAASTHRPWPSSGTSKGTGIRPLPLTKVSKTAAPSPVKQLAAGERSETVQRTASGGERKGAVPAEVKAALLQQAPQVQHSAHLAYWDSSASMMNVRGGMEVSNHWGPTDAHTQLPPERLAELFGTVATYYTPAAKGGGAAAAGAARSAPGGVNGSVHGGGEGTPGGSQPPARKGSGGGGGGDSRSGGMDDEDRALEEARRRKEYRKPPPTSGVTRIAAPTAAATRIGAPATTHFAGMPRLSGSVAPQKVLAQGERGNSQPSAAATAPPPTAAPPLMQTVPVAPGQAGGSAAGASKSSAAQTRPASGSDAVPSSSGADHNRPLVPSAGVESASGGLQSSPVTAPSTSAAAQRVGQDSTVGSKGGGGGGGSVQQRHLTDRQYNEAVLGGHSTDEQLAQALQHEEVEQAAGRSRGTKRKPLPPVRDRLAKKLLSGRAQARALEEIATGEAGAYRASLANRWEEK